MSLQDFQILDNEPFDKSIVKIDQLKIYHQPGAKSNDPDQNLELILEKITTIIKQVMLTLNLI